MTAPVSGVALAAAKVAGLGGALGGAGWGLGELGAAHPVLAGALAVVVVLPVLAVVVLVVAVGVLSKDPARRRDARAMLREVRGFVRHHPAGRRAG